MDSYYHSRAIIILSITLLLLTCFVPSTMTFTINHNYKQLGYNNEGQILFSPMYSTTTYLINKNGEINQSWSSSYNPGASVYMIDNGTVLRTIRKAPFGDGAGGGVQKITWDGTIIWDYSYYSNDYLSHHDIEPLNNGNILIIAWEYKTFEEAIEEGRDPNTPQGNDLKTGHIVEVKQTGPTSGEIVWEWHAWDHLIQDYDPLKDNYGVVEDHPELIDINFGGVDADWLHMNSIEYNEEFDQILVSVRNFNEIWIIDHSTTSEEASGHSGGNSGKGGDILYRWGNPMAYDRGDIDDKKFFGQHDATWIEIGCPGEGHILVFNNGVNRPEGQYSSVDEIIPPVDNNGNYYIEPDFPYGPEEQVWVYTAENPTDFFSGYISGAQRLNNGNTLICEGSKGKFFEVTHEKEKIWEFINPYPNPSINDVFKIQYVLPEDELPKEPDLDCEGSLNWKDVRPGQNIKGHFRIKNIGDISSLLNWKIESYPDWGNWTFNPISGENLTPESGGIYVQISVETPYERNKEFNGQIRVENQEDPEDYDIIPIILKTPVIKSFFNSMIYQIILKLKQILPLLEKSLILFSYLS